MTRRIRTVAFLLAICVADTGVTQDETVGPKCGTLVIVGFASGQIPAAKANYLLYNNLSVTGSPLDIS